jgi:hypothetical protein
MTNVRRDPSGNAQIPTQAIDPATRGKILGMHRLNLDSATTYNLTYRRRQSLHHLP